MAHSLVMMLVVVMMLIFSSAMGASSGLRLGYYRRSCPQAEYVINKLVSKYVAADKSLAPSILRVHFHDCFVRGCDGSVLLNSIANSTAEKDAPPNLTLRGFSLIDAVKTAIESICPGVVSCADILALAARDAVVAIKGPYWNVPTGRRDGTISLRLEALQNLPPPTSNISSLISLFAKKGLNKMDLVALSGSHTIGFSHCNSFSNRLYNFSGKGDMDPSLDRTYASKLKKVCSPTDTTTKVPMDPTVFTFDTKYMVGVKTHRGLFQSDVALLNNPVTLKNVYAEVYPKTFLTQFSASMVKMGKIGVLTGSAGQIRTDCKFVN